MAQRFRRQNNAGIQAGLTCFAGFERVSAEFLEMTGLQHGEHVQSIVDDRAAPFILCEM